MGRTGTLHEFEQDGISPDLMAIAKGLGGGFAPIGALMLSAKIFQTLAQGSGAFQHSHTYTGHPLACAAALAVQRVIRRDDLLANVRRQGAHLERRLRERFGNHPFVGDVRGRGLFQGIELVADRGAKEPFDPARKINARVKQAAMARGLMVYPLGGTADHVLLAPPFIVDAAAVDMIVERLGDAVDAAVGDIDVTALRCREKDVMSGSVRNRRGRLRGAANRARTAWISSTKSIAPSDKLRRRSATERSKGVRAPAPPSTGRVARTACAYYVTCDLNSSSELKSGGLTASTRKLKFSSSGGMAGKPRERAK
jgi:hypothetical protein